MTDTTAPTTTTLPLVPGLWTTDAAHTSVGFSIKRIGWAKVRGTFTDVAVELVVGEALDDTSLTATIDLASVSTGNADRDAHICAPDLLDAAVRKTMTYRSTAISGEGDEWTVEGELSIGDVTRPLALDVTFAGASVFPPDGRLHAGFETSAEIRRKDFGLGFGAMGAGMSATVKVDIDIELIGPEAAV